MAKTKLEDYFKLLKKLRLDENDVYNHINNTHRMGVLLKLIFLSPFAIIGMIHFYLPYIFVKRFVEKSFKRRVFWGSVKMLMGKAIM